MPKTGWLHYAENALAPLCRKSAGSFMPKVDTNYDGESILGFLRQLRRSVRAPIELLWDRLLAHRGEPITRCQARHRARVRIHLFPPYAPELNPVELIWGHVKNNDLANFAPHELPELLDHTQVAILSVRDNEPLLRSFLAHSALFLRLH